MMWLAVANFLLSGCSGAIPPSGSLTGNLSPIEVKLDCRQLNATITGEIGRLKGMPALANLQQSTAPSTLTALYQRMSGQSGAGVEAASDYANSRKRLNLLAEQAATRKCKPVIDVDSQLAETDRIMAGGVWDVATPGEARAMLDRLVIAVKADRAKAFDAVRRGDQLYKDRDLTALCADAASGRVLVNASHEPSTLQGLKDTSGMPYGDAMLGTAREAHVLEVSYLWSRVDKGEPPRPRIGLVTRVGDLVCVVSHFK